VVARLLAVCLWLGLSGFTIVADAEPHNWRETPYYYDTFNPVQTPWHPPPEKNIEEVFKRYEYVAIVYSESGRQLAVSRYLKGQLADTTYWTLQQDDSLQGSGQSAVGVAEAATRSLYLEHCAGCHGTDRLGGAGPALLPANLGRLKQAAAVDVIKNGRLATQMPPFGSQLNETQIRQLVELVYSMPAEPPVWDSDDLDASRTVLQQVLDDFFFDQDYRLLIGADRAQNSGQVIDLDSGKRIAELPLSGMPHLGSGITWEYQGRPVMATPNLRESMVTVIDMQNWQVIMEIKTLGPGFFMCSHENTPYAWTDVFFGPDKDALHVFDKRTLKLVKTLRPEPGMTSAHVEFTRDGRYALVSLWELEGALVVFDAITLEEVKRIPMRKPSGKYNIFNKINRSAGTSH
jgi:mono/diheme cytochrome c family protein